MKFRYIILMFIFQLSAIPTFASNGKAIGHKNKKLKVSTEFQSACASDIQRAGCTSNEDGSDLLMCLHSYKKAHQDYQLSNECKSATLALRKYKKSKKNE